MGVHIEWTGTLEDNDIERAMLVGAELLLEESNRKCPIETGALIRSGVAKADGNKAAVGYNAPYAIPVHEILGNQHDAGREPKWLENAAINHKTRIFEAIADEIKRGMS